MGTVWLARDLLLSRTVAVKQLVHGGLDNLRDDLRRRALREARALALVRHHAIVEIHDVIMDADDPWLVMEYIEGRSLSDIVQRSGPQPVRVVARIGAWVAEALEAAHRAGVLHRDVKPGNILLTGDERVFLVDFGIAMINAEQTALTRPHSLVGTLGFIAPERLAGEVAGPPSDLWSLGVTLYYALEARLPFEGSTAVAMIAKILDEDPPPIKGPLAGLLKALLARDPRARPTVTETIAVLRRPAKPRSPLRDGGGLRSAAPPRAASASPSPPPARVREPADREGAMVEQAITTRLQAAGVPATVSTSVEDLPTRLPDNELRSFVADLPPAYGVRAVLAVPDDRALRVLAPQRSKVLAGLLVELAGHTRGLNMIPKLPAERLGRALGHMPRAAATRLVSALPPIEAARVLTATDPRTAAGPLTDLPESGAVRIVDVMSASGAASVLRYVNPTRIAELFRRMPDRRSTAMLKALSSPVRIQVERHL